VNLIQTAVLTIFLSLSIFFWLVILTKVDYFGVDSVKNLCFILFLISVLNVVWVIQTYSTWIGFSNLLIIVVIFLQVLNIRQRYSSYLLFFGQIVLIIAYFLLFFGLKLNEIDFFIGIGHFSIGFFDTTYNLLNQWKKKKILHKEVQILEHVNKQIFELFQKNQNLLSQSQDDDLEVLRIILRENCDKWMNLPDEIQSFYLQSILKINFN
jgi:hypothetical protein